MSRSRARRAPANRRRPPYHSRHARRRPCRPATLRRPASERLFPSADLDRVPADAIESFAVSDTFFDLADLKAEKVGRARESNPRRKLAKPVWRLAKLD
jgi:hypothetical protein